nr:SIR2 family protein [Helicobacter bizzozeronii]
MTNDQHNQHKRLIKRSLKYIRKAHNENCLSIFAGAGISASSGLPSWKKLIDALKKKLYGNTEKDEDYLILAEKFFNRFGKEHYYQKIRKELKMRDGDDVEPNLHLEIVKLNLKNLITTNWDDLFEKAFDKEKIFSNIIKTDEDIKNSGGFSKLIKMHGSLDKENIVFCEKDYLEYSQNFPLIENYVKGIFSTDTVVLVGYSLGDQNVKQIISWVNFHLNKTQQKSNRTKTIYFIKTSTMFDPIEFEFYEKKNIHVLYIHELLSEKVKSIESENEEECKRKQDEDELRLFFEEIKKYDTSPLINKKNIGEIRHILIYFDFKALENKINTLSASPNASLKDKLLRYFLLFESHIDNKYLDGDMSKIYQQCEEVSKEAFRKREFKIWFSNELNRRWRLDCYKTCWWELPLPTLALISNKENEPKHTTQFKSYFEQQVAQNLLHWKNRGYYNDNGNDLKETFKKLREFNRIRIGKCLITPIFNETAHTTITYRNILEYYWKRYLYKICNTTETKKRAATPLLVNQEIFSHSVRYLQTEKLEEIFQGCPSSAIFQFEADEKSLETILANICSKLKECEDSVIIDIGSHWINNFLVLTSHCLLKPNTRNKILRKSLDFVLYFLNLFIENKAGYREMKAQSIFVRIIEKIPKIDETHENTIINFLDQIHKQKHTRYIRISDDMESRHLSCLNSINPSLPKYYKHYLRMIDTKQAKRTSLYNKTLLPLIETLYKSSNKNLQQAIRKKLKHILRHKKEYEQTKMSKTYCLWLKELVTELDS